MVRTPKPQDTSTEAQASQPQQQDSTTKKSNATHRQRLPASERNRARRIIPTQATAEAAVGFTIDKNTVALAAKHLSTKRKNGTGSSTQRSKDKNIGKESNVGDGAKAESSTKEETHNTTASTSVGAAENVDSSLAEFSLRTLNVEDFVQARAFEIAAMQAALKRDTEHAGQLRVFQTVPRHMRRRAASHNVKRLPSRVRGRALAQIQRDTGKPQQKPLAKRSATNAAEQSTRRKRRRLASLLQNSVKYTNIVDHEARLLPIDQFNNKFLDEGCIICKKKASKIEFVGKTDCHLICSTCFNPTLTECPSCATEIPKAPIQAITEVEASNGRWLETHLWHAKRAKMIQLWGYKLPSHPTDKSFRSAYRSSKLHSLLLDTSYENVFQIAGTMEDIGEIMTPLVDPTMPLMTADKFILGEFQGSQCLYKNWSFPMNFICPVKFLWNQVQTTTKNNVTDKSTKRRLWLLIHPSVRVVVADMIIDSIREKKLGNNISFEDLSSELGSFTLRGPRTHAILQHVLRLTKTTDVNVASHKTWETHLKRLRTPGSLPSGCVLALTINDPRLNLVGNAKMPSREVEFDITEENKRAIELLSEKWTKLSEEEVSLLYSTDITKDKLQFALSKIWDPKERSLIRNERLSDSEINKRRETINVLGTDLEPKYDDIDGKSDPQIPILLIRSLGNSNSGSVSQTAQGWTIVFPKGYGKDLWLNLVFSGGCRVGGLRDEESFTVETGLPSFPIDFPESSACEEYEFRRGGEKWAKWLRTPKGKRFEYEDMATGVFIRDLKYVGILKDTMNSSTEFGNENVSPTENPSQVDLDRSSLMLKVSSIFDTATVGKRHKKDVQRSLPQAIVSGVTNKAGIMAINSPWIIKFIYNEIIKTINSMTLSEKQQKQHLAEILSTESVLKQMKNLLRNGRRNAFLERLTVFQEKPDQSLVSSMFIHISLSFKHGGHPTENDMIYMLRDSKALLKKTEKQQVDGNNGGVVSEEKMELDVDNGELLAIGFVTQGDISYSRAHGFAIGMCSLNSVSQLSWRMLSSREVGSSFKCAAKVLVKSANGIKYQWADMTLIEPVV